jgi:hypothetical protein
VTDACQRVGAMSVIDEAYWRFVLPHEAYSAVELLGATRRQQFIGDAENQRRGSFAACRQQPSLLPSCSDKRYLASELRAKHTKRLCQATRLFVIFDDVGRKQAAEISLIRRVHAS